MEIYLDRGSTRFHIEDDESNEESGGSSNKPMTCEDGAYFIPASQETPGSNCSTILHPIGRVKAKRK